MGTNVYECAWAAGFFDGEGHSAFRVAELRNRPRRRIVAQITQIDREVLDRFQRAVGGGRVYEEGVTRAGNRVFVWRTASRAEVERVLECLKPWLSSIKRRQADAALASYDALNAMTRPILKIAMHGTVSRYNSKKWQCRCDECRGAYAAYHRARRTS